jgi:hypothetical protein
VVTLGPVDTLDEFRPVRVYANIRLQYLSLAKYGTTSNSITYATSILRDQTASNTDGSPSINLDLLSYDHTESASIPLSDYYFSGLSFSTSPVAALSPTDSTIEVLAPENTAYTVNNIFKDNEPYQQVVSLCILETYPVATDDNKYVHGWGIYQPALLPEVYHGDTEGSVKLTTVNVTDTITLGTNNTPVMSLEAQLDGTKYKLVFSSNRQSQTT